MAPVQCRSQRLLPAGGGWAPRRKKPKALLEPTENLIERHHRNPGGGQLDGQRDPVDALTDADDRIDILVAYAKLRLVRHSAISKQADGLVASQWRHPPGYFSRHAQRFPTGCQDFEALAFFEQLNGQLGDGLNDVFTVVKDQQRVPLSEVVRQGGPQPSTGLLFQVQRVCDRLRDKVWPRNRTQLYKPNAIRVLGYHLGRQLESQPRLAGPAWSGQGEGPSLPVEFPELTELAIAADEGGQLSREVACRLLRADWRELLGLFRVDELENVFGSRQVFEAMESEISELDARG